MSGLDLLQSPQFVTVKGKRFVVLEAEAWEALIRLLEDMEDERIAEAALKELEAANGDPQKAGWLKWEEVMEELAE